ncbi:MAG: hypothetical protein LCH67_03265 [Bacteroidetes bacterium]|nr:hypothetical protein [Bacteroidota bacterium]
MEQTEIFKYFELVEKLIGHLAWPMVFLIVFLYFKKEIKSIISRIKTAEIKDIKFELNDKVEEIKKEAVNAGVTMFYPIDLIEREFDKTNEKSKETQIIEAWKRIETSIIKIDKRQDKSNKFDDSLNYLVKNNLIEKYLANLIIGLKELRNLAVHSENINVTDEEFQNWISISKSVIDRLAPKI